MTKSELRIALVQGNATVGDLSGNAAKIIDGLERHRDADLIIFPECFLTGYPLEDLVLRSGFVARVMRTIDGLATTVRNCGGPAILFGAPVVGANLPHNAAILIRPDGSIAVAGKTELPNADVFDEKRVFAPADKPAQPLTLGSWQIGAMICEDMWHGPVARRLADELADVLIVINGSPFEEAKQDLRIAHARRRVADTRLPLLYLNLVGGQDEIVFDGASFAVNQTGHVIAEMPFGVEADMRLTLRKSASGNSLEPDSAPISRVTYPNRLESIYRTCVLGLRDYVRKTGSARVFLGVSGGIDSALVAAMAVDALDADRVVGVMMPSRYTSQESLDLANALMSRLGVRSMTMPIQDAADVVGASFKYMRVLDAARMELAQENIQARLRGLTLMALSNAEGGIVLSTGNKSEMSVGYATLYGDMCGGYNPLKDIYKTDVWALSRWRNTNVPDDVCSPVNAPIPEEIIARPPTAELKPGQSDEQSLGSYEVLDALLRGLIEHNLDAEAARRRAEYETGTIIDPDHAQRISDLVRQAEYKRRQAPPGVKLTSRSFGRGWRYPISNKGQL